MKLVRRLRILEYIGTEDFVNDCIERRRIKGRLATPHGSITEGWLGETNEILSESELESRLQSVLE